MALSTTHHFCSSFLLSALITVLKKFYGRCPELINSYHVSISQIIIDIFADWKNILPWETYILPFCMTPCILYFYSGKWRVLLVGQEMLTLSRTPDLTLFGVHLPPQLGQNMDHENECWFGSGTLFSVLQHHRCDAGKLFHYGLSVLWVFSIDFFFSILPHFLHSSPIFIIVLILPPF